MISFSVPFWGAVVIMILGAIIWISEQTKKARKRNERRAAARRLAADLKSPPPAAQLPYGLPAPDDPDTGPAL